MTTYNVIDGVHTPLTEEEISAIDLQNLKSQSLPKPAFEAALRFERDAKLAACDWVANSDVTMSDAWRTYRAALRDVPAQAGFPASVTWPTEPS